MEVRHLVYLSFLRCIGVKFMFRQQNPSELTSSQRIESCQTEEELDQLLDDLPVNERLTFLALRRRCEIVGSQLRNSFDSVQTQNDCERNQSVSKFIYFFELLDFLVLI